MTLPEVPTAFLPVRTTPDPDAGREPPSQRVGACTLYRLQLHMDARGSLHELGRASWLGPIAQAYVSRTEPDTVKGWHLHRKQTDRFYCLSGSALVCFVAERRVAEVMLRADTPMILVIPPGVPHGWWTREGCAILNLCSHEYDGTDEYRASADLLAPDWDWRRRRDG